MKKQLLLGAIAGSAIAGSMLVSPSAHALSLTGDSCSAGVIFSGTDVAGCDGNFSGNDSEGEVNSGTGLFGTGLFGETDWDFFAKLDSESGIDPDGVTVSPEAGGLQTWSFSSGVDLTSYEQVAFILKGGPTFSAYLWDGITTTGVFNTQGIYTGGGKAGPALSHFSIYVRGEKSTDPDPDPNPVPTPAAVLPILGGLFGAASRRKQNENESENA